jgi:hypothetical protein
MAIQYRSKIDFAAILNSDKEGFNLGVDSSIFLREEAQRGVFAAPRIGVQGSSAGGAGAPTNISALTDTDFNVSVDGSAPLLISLVVAGLTTGAAIAAALEVAINTALIAAGYDARVWVYFNGVDVAYEIYSQSTGLTSSVVVTDALVNNIADDLLLGVANTGVELVGVDDQDFLLYTTGGAKFEQPIETSPHRTERFHSGFIRKKTMCDFDITTMINMAGTAGNSLDSAVKLLLKSVFGRETTTLGVAIDYEQSIPSTYFTLVRASTIFAEYYTGAYCKDFTLTVPGDAPGTMQFTGRAAFASIAGIGLIDAPVVASNVVTLSNAPYKHVERFSAGARVMVVAADGRTITHGADGSIYITSENQLLDTVTLSVAVDAAAGAYLTFWHPGAVQATARDNIYTDLYGTFKFKSTGIPVCATNISLNCVNDHFDRDNCFGSQGNEGFVAANKMTMTLECTLDLSGDNIGDLVQARKFGGFSPELLIGDGIGRSLLLTAPKWVTNVPAVELPESGTTSYTFSGVLYQSAPGARDPLLMSFV